MANRYTMSQVQILIRTHPQVCTSWYTSNDLLYCSTHFLITKISWRQSSLVKQVHIQSGTHFSTYTHTQPSNLRQCRRRINNQTNLRFFCMSATSNFQSAIVVQVSCVCRRDTFFSTRLRARMRFFIVRDSFASVCVEYFAYKNYKRQTTQSQE